MKKAFRFIIVFLFFSSSKLIAQIPEIINKSDYVVTGSETLIASKRITLKPQTSIKAGSIFIAKVVPNTYSPFSLSNENYIFSRVFQTALTNSSSIASDSDVIESIIYYDGLGRPMQNIAIKGSPSKKDIVTHHSYDNFGRKDKEYLPYMDISGVNGIYKNSAEINTNDYYKSNYAADINALAPNPFSQMEFEKSPLNRVFKQAAPGKDWAINSGHEIKFDYQSNTVDEVKLYYAVTTWNAASGLFEITFSEAGNYVANQLFKTVTYDENTTANPIESAGSTLEFKNKKGQIVLKRTYESGIKHDTYYVYDIYGNLTYVIPPKADGSITVTVLNDLCYQYKYDHRNRLVEKKLPGKQWEYIIYDKLDRPILIQDANLRVGKKWLFTKYDAFNRPVYTGEYKNTVQIARNALQLLANASASIFETKQIANSINGTTIYYSNNAFPNINDSNINLLTINYYDDYSFDTLPVAAPTPIINAKGLTTGSKVRILGKSDWITNWNYYDAKGRPTYNYSKNDYLGTTSTIKTDLDFVGKVLKTTATHFRNNVTTTIVDTFTYDTAGRLTKQEQAINGAVTPEIIVANTYDELGQVISKKVGGKTTQGLQTVDFKYNIRGWLKNINDVNAIGTDLFAFQINYNDIADTNKKLFNGNISQTFWKTANQDTSIKNYIYTYDKLNRLKSAVDNLNKFNESLNYDKNGNITSLVRLGQVVGGVPLITNPTDFGTMDNLIYTYDTGNKLQIVSDSANDTYGFKDDFIGSGSDTTIDYTYDDNGNMLTDTNKGITNITYNYLNLPTQVTIGGQNIVYEYDATGVKQQKKANGIVTDYAESFIYEENQLKFFSQPEGYVAYNLGTFDYIYQYKDHLGNVRLSYDKNLIIQEENNYYPFGLKHMGYNNINVLTTGSSTAQKYKFQGQERQDELGLGWDSFKWRNYDPAMARFMNIDPLTEDYNNWSPYVFSGNRVVDARELEGLEPYVLFNTEDDAALNWGQQYNGKSIRDSREYGSTIGRKKVKGKYKYSYGPPKVSESSHSVYPSPAPKGSTRTADIHSHGSYDPKIGSWNDRFSDEDKAGNRKSGITGYLTTPNGNLLMFLPNGDGEFIINSNLENDRNDPTSPPSVMPVTPLTPMPIVPSPTPSPTPIPVVIPGQTPKPVVIPGQTPKPPTHLPNPTRL